MFSLLWNLSAAFRGYLRSSMPTNRAVDWLSTPLGAKWAVPVAVLAGVSYLYATGVCATLVERGGPGSLNVLVILYFWNTTKCVWLVVLTARRALLAWSFPTHGAQAPLRR